MMTRLFRSLLIGSCVIGSLPLQGMQAMRRFLIPRPTLLRPAIPRQQITSLTAKSFKKPLNLRNSHLLTQVKTVQPKNSSAINIGSKPHNKSQQSSWWQRFSNFCSSSFKSAMYRMQGFNPFAKRTTLLGGTALAAASLIKANNKAVEFNKANIDAHPELKDLFIEQAKKDIATQDQATIETILHLLEKYHDAALRLGHEVIKNFIKTDFKIFEKVVVGIKDDAALSKALAEKTSEAIQDCIKNEKLLQHIKFNHVLAQIPQAITPCAQAAYKAITNQPWYKAQETIFWIALMPPLVPDFLKDSLEKLNSHCLYLLREPRMRQEINNYLKTCPDQSYVIHPDHFNDLLNTVDNLKIYSFGGTRKISPDTQGIFTILVKNFLRPEIMSGLGYNLSYILKCLEDAELTPRLVEQVAHHMKRSGLNDVFNYWYSFTVITHKSDYLLQSNTTCSLKDAVLKYVSDPAIFAALPFDRAEYFYSHMQNPAPMFKSILKEQMLKPDQFSKMSDYALVEEFIKDDAQFADHVATVAIKTNHAILQKLRYNSQSPLSKLILAHVSDPNNFAQLQPEQAEYFYKFIQNPSPEIDTLLKNQIAKPERFEKTDPNILNKMMTRDGGFVDTVAHLAVTTDNKILSDILANPHRWATYNGFNSALRDKILEQTKDLNNVHESALEAIHPYVTSAQQEVIQKTIEKKLGAEKTDSVVDRALLYFDKSKLLTKCTDKNHGNMPTEQHYCANKDTVLSHFKREKENMTPSMRTLFIDLFKKEQEEVAKGNYVFYHGQRWPWHFKSDIYKEFMKIVRPAKVRDDYQFLRFAFNHERNSYYVRDALFMNSALFANAEHDGACTFHYLLENRDCSNGRDQKFSSQWMADHFKMKSYYERHKQEFNELEELHNSATKNGNCLLISVPADKVDKWVYPADYAANKELVQTTNRQHIGSAKQVIDMLKKNPKDLRDSNYIQYAMPMEGDVLDPHKGPRIYSFNNADQKIMAEYAKKRDKLFAEIRQEMMQDQQAAASKLVNQNGQNDQAANIAAWV